jgi:hypothetical protein
MKQRPALFHGEEVGAEIVNLVLFEASGFFA